MNIDIDCRGMICPAPILKISKAARQHKVDPVLLVVRADDGDFPTDVQAWCRSTGARLVKIESEGGAFVAHVALNGAPDALPVPTSNVPPSVLPDAGGLDVRGKPVGHALLLLGQAALDGDSVSFTADAGPLEAQLAAWAPAAGVTIARLERDGAVLRGRLTQGPVTLPPSAIPASVPASAPAQAAAPAADGPELPRENRCTLLVLHDDFEALMAAMMVANTSAAQGMQVEIYFSFWGVNVLRGPRHQPAPGSELDRPTVVHRLMKWMMPAGPDARQMGQMNFGGAGAQLMKYLMRRQNVLGLRELMAQAAEQDIKFVVCTMSMGIMGVGKNDLMDLPNLEFGGVTAFSAAARRSAVSLVF